MSIISRSSQSTFVMKEWTAVNRSLLPVATSSKARHSARSTWTISIGFVLPRAFES